MKRIEVMISQAIEVDFEEAYLNEAKKLGIKDKFTKVTNVLGKGNSDPKYGDAIWPQLNSMYIIYCDEDLAEKIALALQEVNKNYPGEGAAAFITDAEILV